MCGFVAVIARDGQTPDLTTIGRMTDLLAHRGPDDRGLFREPGIALGFRRLAILDLAPSGHQPMLSPDGRYVMVYNGEIYNYAELRGQLQALGHAFRSTGDTEVLLTAYREWGKGCLERLNGMWAFVIYDRVARTLFGARDRFGVKPLFHYRNDSALVFASEIKAIRDSGFANLSVNRRTLARALLDGELDTGDETFYDGVSHVPAGCAFECDSNGSMRQWYYWSLHAAVETLESPVEPVSRFRELFEDSIALRLRSDRPVGVQLSGGLDSTSIIVSMARRLEHVSRETQRLRAFCYADPEFDETPEIDATVDLTKARMFRLGAHPRQLWDRMQIHLWHQDEPVHSFSSVVGYELMALARANDVRVLLNGQGADEVLAGYPSYFTNYWAQLIRSGRWWTVASAMRALNGTGCDAGRLALSAGRMALLQVMRHVPGYATLADGRRRREARSDTWVSAELKNDWHRQEVRSDATLTDVLRSSVERHPLPLYLRVEDRNSMAHGIEVRLPFLDYRLVTLAFKLDASWKLRGAYGKVVLREAMRDRVPEIIRTRVQKFGFPTGANSWLRKELYAPFRDLLNSRVVRDSGLWNVAAVESALERHKRGELNVGARLFEVAETCLWLHGSKHWRGIGGGTHAAENAEIPSNWPKVGA